MDKPKYPIESVDNALKLLLQFKERESLGVSEAGEHLGVAPSTAHRLLSMLQYRGFAIQDDDSKAYRPGPALIEIGLKTIREMSLLRQARPAIERLSERLDETVHLLVREGADVRFVDGAESSRALRVTSRTGILLPAHCTAGGKALLAELSPGTLRELYPARALSGLTARSVRSRDDLERELATVRARGFATNAGESEDDVTAIGVAVRDHRGRQRAAIAVALPSVRASPERIDEIAAAAVAGAQELGALLD
ncbi:MAG: IclR family transcriptional regulator [Candidatus Limnocylindrales bacterium]|nr:IclR family transcriptional regulator [Chloroflexota bacterium]